MNQRQRRRRRRRHRRRFLRGPTAGRSKFKTRVAAKNASVGTQLYRATRKIENDRETDLRSVEIHIRCRCNQRALWAVRILEQHPNAKPIASRSNLNCVSLQTSHFSNQGFCAASCQPSLIFAQHKLRHPISKPTAGRLKFRTGVAPNNRTQLSHCDTQSRNRPKDGRNFKYVSVHTSHASNQLLCAASYLAHQIFPYRGHLHSAFCFKFGRYQMQSLIVRSR